MTLDLRPLRPLLLLLALAPTALMVLFIVRAESVDEARGGASAEASPAVPASIADPARVSPAQSLFRERNLARAVAALRDRMEPRQKLLKAEVRPHVVEFHLRAGDGATGFSWLARERKLRPIGVRIVGDDPLDGEHFALERLRTGAPARLAARVREEAGGLRAQAMALERVAPDGYLQWTVLAAAEGRTAAYFAEADGRGLAPPEDFTSRRLSP